MLAKLGFHHLDIDTKYEKLLFVEQFTIDSVVSKDIDKYVLVIIRK